MPIATITPTQPGQNSFTALNVALNNANQNFGQALNQAIQSTQNSVATQLAQERAFLTNQNQNLQLEQQERFDKRNRVEFLMNFGQKLERNAEDDRRFDLKQGLDDRRTAVAESGARVNERQFGLNQDRFTQIERPESQARVTRSGFLDEGTQAQTDATRVGITRTEGLIESDSVSREGQQARNTGQNIANAAGAVRLADANNTFRQNSEAEDTREGIQASLNELGGLQGDELLNARRTIGNQVATAGDALSASDKSAIFKILNPTGQTPQGLDVDDTLKVIESLENTIQDDLGLPAEHPSKLGEERRNQLNQRVQGLRNQLIGAAPPVAEPAPAIPAAGSSGSATNPSLAAALNPTGQQDSGTNDIVPPEVAIQRAFGAAGEQFTPAQTQSLVELSDSVLEFATEEIRDGFETRNTPSGPVRAAVFRPSTQKEIAKFAQDKAREWVNDTNKGAGADKLDSAEKNATILKVKDIILKQIQGQMAADKNAAEALEAAPQKASANLLRAINNL